IFMDTREQIGKKIKEIREKAKLSQVQVADKAGISVNYFARLERGEVNPSAEVLKSIAKSLNVKSGDILPF
ncbi:MAG: helix-turn-helix transcriptional regulator, partial [Candidatus Shapirobacteria bacterium]|nr:helix-turn-helix transcriptional regulator [Candidatus Shapirobacteria bacterium]